MQMRPLSMKMVSDGSPQLIVTRRSAASMPMLEQNFDAAKTFVNKDIVEQKSSIHCHPQNCSTSANA